MISETSWIIKKELNYYKIPLLMTIAAAGLIALLVFIPLEEIVLKLSGEMDFISNFLIVDIVFVGLTPSFAAIFMSQPYLSIRAFKDDPFNKRMALYRSMPIPLKTIVLSKITLMIITLVIISVTFYTILTLLLFRYTTFFTYISTEEFLYFLLFWIGYAAALGGYSTFIEYGTNGKILHLSSYISLLCLIIIMIVVQSISGRSIVEWSFFLTSSGGILLSLMMIIIGITGCFTWYFILFKRLRRRDYL